MKTLVIYYSFGGNTRELALSEAKEREAQLCEVMDVKKPSTFGAFLHCPAAMQQKPGKIHPISENLAQYQQFVVMGPIWAGCPAPPVNSILLALPQGANVELQMLSASGNSKKSKVLAFLQKHDLVLTQYVDVKA